MEHLAVKRAEEGEWHELIDLAENVPHCVMIPDEFGMLPLHWACTEPTVPLDTLHVLLRVYPEGCEVKNLSGMLPLHVAIASKLPGVHLNALVDAYPPSVYMKGGDGLFPAEMARRHRLPDHSVNVLKKSMSLDLRSSTSTAITTRPTDASILRHSASDLNLPSFEIRGNIPRNSSWESVDKLKSISMSSGTSTSSSTYSAVSSPKSFSSWMSAADPDELGAELRELSGQLAALQVEMRHTNSTSEPVVHSVLWNPGDRLGVSLEPAVEEPPSLVLGARVKRLTGKSEALGISSISIGDQLLSVNGIDVTQVPFATICKFLKKTNVTCKLTFASSSLQTQVTSPTAVDVRSILATTLHKVQNVEDIVRLSSAMTA
ncbi:hypothetical protein H310_10308 [Aphanomyces invadans]|uniref:PDZ domain-containing protein n=1 Tax=Aphanomyces invadans TaxID=157072 RepID=A0A024TRF3_9STRA|nr:hypothetical protein H310_10308 [Aphanomyces invadans]ETV96608.1 hypothetical protein H310_10308 [Aphanomyces invadans]RHY22658.1 hypothetical protein DYB32_009440 [Aphanomyces invadans]|eukprot:XP_008874871.1 hypothetical protein H310_10308 [Aphanomyces invadans]